MAQVFQQERQLQIEEAMRNYQTTHQIYEDKLRAALAEQDVTKRATLVQEASAKNNELTTIVQGIITAIKNANSGNDTEQSVDLKDKVDEYKRQLAIINQSSDRTQTLNSLLTDLSHSSSSYENYYIGYAVAVLILIIMLIILFMTTGGGGNGGDGGGGDFGSSVLPGGPSPIRVPIKIDVV